MGEFRLFKGIVLLFLGLISFQLNGQSLEHIDRGLIAIPTDSDGNFISWRLLNSDDSTVSFNVYRNQKRLTLEPLFNQTSFTDKEGRATDTYTVVPVMKDTELQEKSATCKVWANSYLEIPLQQPERYRPNDASVGDLDGDGQYEIVVHMAGRGADNSFPGLTDPTIIQAYELNGTLLWEINLGKNIREGAHYTQFMVYDLDGDGKAEVAMKTADGTIDGKGNVIGDAEADWRNLKEKSRRYGRILDGPEYFTVFSGETGEALATADYIPSRYPINGWGGVGGNGDNDSYGNRCDRFLACVAYLDGEMPSVVMCRGYYGRSVLAAWDYRNGELTSRWVFDSANPGLEEYSGMGNHSVAVADVDGDGKSEIVYGAMVVDDDGTGLFSTNLRHGDALHVSDLDPTHPGLEVFGGHEFEKVVPGYMDKPGMAMYAAGTGEILMQWGPGHDVGRAVAADIDSMHYGAELWGHGNGLVDINGSKIGSYPSSTNFVIWWDGDLLRELLDRTRIDKYGQGTIFEALGCRSNNGSKSTPALSADLFGDWREEVMFRTRDNSALRIYSTTIPTRYRFVTLMHDVQYRLSVAWQNVGYNQPPHPGFYLGAGIPENE